MSETLIIRDTIFPHCDLHKRTCLGVSWQDDTNRTTHALNGIRTIVPVAQDLYGNHIISE